MAFLKTARGALLRPDISPEFWHNFQVRTARLSTKGSTDLVAQASQLFQRPFDPQDYLLSHVTIVASVDTYDVPDMPVGKDLVNGFQVNRKFSNFRISSESQKFINNNKDAWDRPVILVSYKTFIGAHNWCEHVQIEDLSKGRVIDAVARDIGPSVYIDILIATERKHQELIRAIQRRKLNTLSMGCSIEASQCTKCGHWAHDETEMCPCVKYSKGNVFFDGQGRKHIIAELCGHKSIDPTGGVKFIDASWVEVPAFEGAVLRSLVEPTPEINLTASKVLSQPAPEWSLDEQVRQARVVGSVSDRKAQWDDPGFGPGPAEDPDASPEDDQKDENPIDKSIEDVEQHILDQVVKRLKEKVRREDIEETLSPEDSSAEPNENLVKWATTAWRAISACASSDVAMVDAIAQFNQNVGIQVPVEVYRAALMVGPRTRYASVGKFVEACSQALRRKTSPQELKQILALSTLLSTRRPPSASTNDGGH